MTMIEVLIALAIGGLLLMTVASMTMFSSKSLAGLYNYVELSSANRLALDKMTREIRQTQRLSEFTTNKLTFVDFDDKRLVYQYFPSDRVLMRSKNGVDESLLTECDSLTFTAFQRNTLEGTFDQARATNDSKVINLNWTCSRKILGTRVNTETVQSAKIVIRKR